MIIDLSIQISTNTPVYPGDPTIKITPNSAIDTDGYIGHQLQLGTHSGTHLDAPAHMIKDGKTIDRFSLDRCIGRGVYIDVRGDLFHLDTVQKADIHDGDIVIFNTGMSEYFHENRYFTEYPVMSSEIAKYLVSRKIKMVGLDTCSADNKPTFPIHHILLENDILIIENLANIEKLKIHKTFKIYAIPLPLGVDGAPARVFAEIS